MAVSTKPTNPLQAVISGVEHIQITAPRWGDLLGVVNNVTETTQSNDQGYSLAALGIDPSSTVDAVRVVSTAFGTDTFEFILAPERPIVTSLPSPWHFELLNETMWSAGEAFLPINTSVLTVLNDIMGNDNAGDAIFEIPSLVMIGYLKPPLGAIGGPRAKLVRTVSQAPVDPATTPVRRVYPVGGRAGVRIVVRCSGVGASFDATITGIAAREADPGVAVPFKEFILAGPTTIATGLQETFVIDPLMCEFLLLRESAEVAAAASYWDVTAWDLGG